MKLFAPHNEHLFQLLDKFDSDRPFKGYKREKLLYILHVITTIPAVNKKIVCSDGYVPLSSKALEDVVHNYKAYLDLLMREGVLVTDGFYIPEQKCKGYKLLQAFTSIHTLHFEPKDFTLRKSLNQVNKLSTAKVKQHKHLLRWYNDDLTIDIEASLDFIYNDWLLKMENLSLRDRVTRRIDYYPFKKEEEKDPDMQHRAAEVNIKKLQLKEYSLTIDDTGGRLHSTLTNLYSQVRNFITYKGKYLVSIDICNSQPYFSLLLLNPQFWVKGSESFNIDDLGSLIDNIKCYTDSGRYYDIFSLVFMFLNIPEILTSKGVERYKHQCAKGELYSDLVMKYEEISGVKLVDPKVIKETVFQTMFTDNRFIGQPDAEFKRFFRDQFAVVYELFRIIKKPCSENLPILLQLIESQLILHRVCGRINSERPDLPIFTIHDSIITTEGNESYVDAILKEELLKLVGIVPTTKVEYLRPENAVLKDKSSYTHNKAA